ncbi:MAG TPA: SMP-30/gluconolactonase/LRE family protein [Flavobacterium sp.]|nr:SMP-30/gluconolactonase/LRE family protein [Flavobacterium sp.]
MKCNLFNIVSFICLVLLSTFLQAQISDSKNIVSKNASLELLADGYIFTEGPAVDQNGNVFFTDQPYNKIIRWDAQTKKTSVFSSESGRSNGMYFDNKGNLITCADMDNQLWQFDNKGNHKIIYEDTLNAHNGPNDLWIDAKNGIYFTDPLYVRNYWKRDSISKRNGKNVYYLSSDRKSITTVDDNLVQPNGIVGTPDGKILYVADIGDSKTYVYAIQKDATLTNRKIFCEMGSDGMTVDNQGNVYLTGNGVHVFDKNGNKIAQIPVPESWTANVCFGGKDFNILFITAMDSVYGLKMNVKGVR